jgi:PAS domain S-box-containing protein
VFKVHETIEVVQMTEFPVESSAEVVVDLNEKKPIRVLHVDDETSLLKIAKQCLEIEGPFQVDTASSVDEAIKKMEKETYDVVVSDYQMPGKDGLEFLKELRAIGNSIPFIMFTGKGREEVAIKALNLGANQYLNKVGETETVYVELAHSITELAKARKAEEKQREPEEKFRDLFEKANDGIVFVDMSGRIVDVNQKAAEIAEKRKEDIVGKSFFDLGLVSSKDLPVLVEKLTEQATGKPTERFEFEIEKENGEKRLIEINSAIFQKNNVPTGSLAIVRDVTERKITEEALRKSEAELRAQFYGSPDLIMILDRNHRYVRINRNHFLSYDVGKLIGRDAIEPLPPDQRDLARTNVDQCFATGEIQEFEHNLPNGERIHARVVPLQTAGTVDQVMIISTNITERKKTEAALKESKDQLELQIKRMPIGCIVWDKEFKAISWNPAAETIFGYSAKDAKGKHPYDIIVPKEAQPAVDKIWQRLLEGDETAHSVNDNLTKDGKTITCSWTNTPLKREDNSVIGVLSMIQDITERKKAEKLVQESHQKFEGLFRHNPEAAVYLDPDFQILEVNPRFTKLFGFSLDEVRGKHIDDVIVPKDRIEEAKMLGREFMKGYTYCDTVRKRKDGSLVPVAISGGPLAIEGKIIGTLALYVDIAERKHYENSLSALNNYSQDLSMAENMEEIYRLTLDAMQKVLGFEYADFFMIDKGVLCIVDQRGYPEPFPLELPLDGSKKGISIKVAKTGNSVIVQDVRKNRDFVEGLPGILSELAVPIKVGQKTFGVLNVESEKLSAFNEKDQEMLEILASHAAIAISNITRRYEVERHSSQMALLMKNSAEVIHSTDLHHRLQSIVDAIKEIGWRRVGIRLTDENLDTLRVQDMVTAGFTHEEKEFMWKNRSTGQLWRRRYGPEGERFRIGEFYYFTWSDPWVREMFSRSMVPSNLPPEELGDWDPRDSLSAPLRLADGRIVGILGIDDPLDGKRPTKESLAPLELFTHQAAVVIENAQLIQQQKEYAEYLEEKVDERTKQLKETQQQLIKSERLAAIGQVAAMVGHDLRNPLAGIKGATYFLNAKLGSQLDAKSKEMLELIDKGVQHADRIITDLMEYSKEIRLQLSETTPKIVVEEALAMIQVPKNIQLIDLSQDEPVMKMDVEKVKRVFDNLVKNAIDAMSDGGKLTIATRPSEGDVEFVFIDTGTGMAKEVTEKLWTPFLTTKSKGMGLGLSICKRFIEAHGGKISVATEVGKGTTFTITMPTEPQTKEGGEKAEVRTPNLLSMTNA